MTEIFNVLINLAALAVLGVLFIKVRRVDKCLWDADARQRQELDKLFWQIEALEALNRMLTLPRALPATRGWAGSPDFLLAIANHVLDTQPLRVLECSSGASTVVLARCAQINGCGHVYSLEHDPRYAEQTRADLRRQQLEAFATVLDAPLEPVEGVSGLGGSWYSLDGLPDGVFDMLVIDGPPADEYPKARLPAGPLLFNRMRKGAAIFLDDADRPGEREIASQWLARIDGLTLERLTAEKGLAKFMT